MIEFLRKVDSYFRSKPWLFFSILGVLGFFVLTTIILSLACPPAVLAVGIGACSQVGCILPVVALSLLSMFIFFTIVTQIPQMFRTPADDFRELALGLASIPNAMADLGASFSSPDQPEIRQGVDPHGPDSYKPVLVSPTTARNESQNTTDRTFSCCF